MGAFTFHVDEGLRTPLIYALPGAEAVESFLHINLDVTIDDHDGSSIVHSSDIEEGQKRAMREKKARESGSSCTNKKIGHVRQTDFKARWNLLC